MARLPVQYPDRDPRRRRSVPTGARRLSRSIMSWLWLMLFVASAAVIAVHVLV
jgi:hypothetical protein